MIIKNSNFKGTGFASGCNELTRQIENEEKKRFMQELFKKKFEGMEEENNEEEHNCMTSDFQNNMNKALEVIDEVLNNINKKFKHRDDFRSIFFIDVNLIKEDQICMISSFLEGEENQNKHDIWEARMDFMYDVLKDHGIHDELLETTIWYYYINRYKENCYEMMNLLVLGEGDEHV